MMTLNVSFIMTCFPKIVIQNGGKNALWERRETGQWHRVKNLLRWWRLTVFLTTGIDSSLALWMTLNVPFIMTLFPSSVILNGVEKALREKRETEQWHGVKNLWLWWRLTVFLTTVIDSSHLLRMTINAPLTTTANPLLIFRMTPNGNHLLRLLTHS